MRTRTGITLFSGLMVLSLAASSAFATGHGLVASDVKFIMAAATAGTMEVELGKYAQSHGQAQVVKDFGLRMATDHKKAGDELAEIARNKDVKLPGELTRSQKATVESLEKLSGADFDKKYVKQMVNDHVHAVADFKHAVRATKDADLKAWAGLTLPVLEEHLRLVKDAAVKVNTGREVTTEGTK